MEPDDYLKAALRRPGTESRQPMEHLHIQLSELEHKMLRTVSDHQDLVNELHPHQQMAGRNLLHYLTLRSEDIRSLQDELHIFGLSSLASSESHVHSQLQAILQRLGDYYPNEDLESGTYETSRADVKQKTLSLFGEKNDPGIPYIMVTFDSSFAHDYGLIKNLLQNGMNIARINCAHDDEETWAKMVHLVRKACRKSGLKCKIYMDLAGPKIRTKLLTKGKKKGKVKVQEGRLIWLAEKATKAKDGEIVISCTEKGIIKQLKKGEKVLFDDGIVRGDIEIVEDERVGLRILRISSPKSVIKENKGINFPESALNISPLTKFDEECLPFICEYGDLLGFSFVRNRADLVLLQHKLKKLTETPPRLIIKIEAVEAVKNLPSLLLQGMQQETFGVMIARGDLAVEVGFERMSEVQEEILWICEAAHAPVIWATQVLETLNKSGIATRSEITDAAHAVMAECVMINKGSHTIEVIETLRDILQRSGGHHVKKRFIFRPLSIAQNFLNTD
jgi:pyruvate kinase